MIDSIKINPERDLTDLLAMLESENPRVRIIACRIAFVNADAFGNKGNRNPFRRVYHALSHRMGDNELVLDEKGNMVKIGELARTALQRISQYIIQDDYAWAAYSEGDLYPLAGELKKE
ncbi:MAG: hypothetical protein NT076_00970 [Candidatus Pacearchaeota archaeon]|nr:hypothetical protein [Candidatus Pacearchaeota archaeon]